MDWKTLLAFVTGSVDENLLWRIEYLVAGNRTLRDQIKGRRPRGIPEASADPILKGLFRRRISA